MSRPATAEDSKEFGACLMWLLDMDEAGSLRALQDALGARWTAADIPRWNLLGKLRAALGEYREALP